MDIQIVKIKDIRGRRIVGYRARFGALECDAKTPADAKANLEREMLLLGSSASPYKVQIHGFTIIVARGPYGISTFIVCPDGDCVDSGTGKEEVFGEAEESARYHVAQMLWPDERAFSVIRKADKQADFRHWADWQARYAEAKAHGKPDEECRAFANAA